MAALHTNILDITLDFTDALFNPTKGTEKTTKTPKEVTKSS